jgi:hypothetical protein
VGAAIVVSFSLWFWLLWGVSDSERLATQNTGRERYRRCAGADVDVLVLDVISKSTFHAPSFDLVMSRRSCGRDYASHETAKPK